jgi:hypothetical protein
MTVTQALSRIAKHYDALAMLAEDMVDRSDGFKGDPLWIRAEAFVESALDQLNAAKSEIEDMQKEGEE